MERGSQTSSASWLCLGGPERLEGVSIMSWSFVEDQRVPGIPQGLDTAKPLPSSAPGTITLGKTKPSKTGQEWLGGGELGKPNPLLVNGVISWGFYLWAFFIPFSYLGVSKGNLPTMALGRPGQVVLG